MTYLIDGHNLIGQLPDISLDDPNDEAKLVQKLSGFVARTKRKCVVVFDHGVPGGASRMSTRGVNVVFASSPANADLVIMSRIRKARNPKDWTVVSSDNEVLSMARRHKMQTIRANDFVTLLNRPPVLKPDVGEATDVRMSSDDVDYWMGVFEGKDE